MGRLRTGIHEPRLAPPPHLEPHYFRDPKGVEAIDPPRSRGDGGDIADVRADGRRHGAHAWRPPADRFSLPLDVNRPGGRTVSSTTRMPTCR